MDLTLQGIWRTSSAWSVAPHDCKRFIGVFAHGGRSREQRKGLGLGAGTVGLYVLSHENERASTALPRNAGAR